MFQGHPSNFKVTQAKNSTTLTRIKCFRAIALVLIDEGLWNDTQSFKWHRRSVLLFFEIIRQISRSQGLKIQQF